MNELETLETQIEAAFRDRGLLKQRAYVDAVHAAIRMLDRGEVRAASKQADGTWQTHGWVKEAILLYFSVAEMRTMELPPFEFYDRVPLKKGLAVAGVRVVPPGAVRYGAFCERSVVVMPGYVNIGAYVGAGTLVDTWATVGTCAQVGKNVHLSGGVGLGGVLEPASAQPVIIEDGAFIGSRCVIVEGIVVGEEAVLGANTVLTASTPIIDVTRSTEVILRGRIPPRSVVIPGTRLKRFPAGEYQLPCALIIGQRQASTDLKTSLTAVLRDFALPA